MRLLDLTTPEHAYLYGFCLCDGTLTRGPGRKGRLTVEVAVCDEPLLFALASVIPVPARVSQRTRATNFQRAHTSAVLTVNALAFRESLAALGFPEGRKSSLVAPPAGAYSSRDFFRGVVDADGSLGLDRRGYPFVSLCTTSDRLAEAFIAFTTEVTGQPKQVTRNRRDGAYNVMSWKEQAQAIVGALYPANCLALARKTARAAEVRAWSRPPTLTTKPHRRWTADEDAIAMSLSTREAMLALGRTEASVALRKRRLRRGTSSDA